MYQAYHVFEQEQPNEWNDKTNKIQSVDNQMGQDYKDILNTRSVWKDMKTEWFDLLCSHGACGKCKKDVLDPSSEFVACGSTLKGIKNYEKLVDKFMIEVIKNTN